MLLFPAELKENCFHALSKHQYFDCAFMVLGAFSANLPLVSS